MASTPDAKATDDSCSVCHARTGTVCGPCVAGQIRFVHQRITQAKAQKNKLELKVSHRLTKKKAYERQIAARRKAMARVETYARVVALLKKANAEQRAATMRGRLHKHERLLELQNAKTQLTELKQRHSDTVHREDLQQLNTRYQEVKHELALRRRALAHQLLGLIPIKESDHGAYCIADVRLPTKRVYTGDVKGVIVSAALGTCVQLIQLLSKYLGIPLPNAMFFMGSRSLLWCPAMELGRPLKYPLYYVGGEAAERQSKEPGEPFHAALRMLNDNITAMNFWYGVVIPSSQRYMTLPNILALYQLPCLGQEPPVYVDLESLPPSHPLAARSDRASTMRSVQAPLTPKHNPGTRRTQSPQGTLITGNSARGGNGGRRDGRRQGDNGGDGTRTDDTDDAEDWDLVEEPFAPPPSDESGLSHWIATLRRT